MTLEIFFVGFLGGLIVQVHYYIQELRDQVKTKKMTPEQYKKREIYLNKNIDGIIPEYNSNLEYILKEKKEILGLFSQTDIFICFFYAFLGGVMAQLINPEIPFFAFYIGLTSSSFISKFQIIPLQSKDA